MQSIDFKGHTLEDLAKLDNPERQSIKDKLLSVLDKYLVSPEHHTSNETYWRTVFAVATEHVNELQQGKKHTAFDICKIVIEENMPPQNTMYKGQTYQKTEYPKKMVDEWNAWCALQQQAPYYLTNDAMRFNVFTVAYAYLVTEKENNLPKGYILD